jgi:hypothetical protein
MIFVLLILETVTLLKWRAQLPTRKKYTLVDRFPLLPVATPIGDIRLTHVMRLAAHSTTSSTLTAMRQSFIITL